MAKKKANQPVHEIRMGRVKATIWANDTSAGTRHNVTMSRLYKEGDSWEPFADKLATNASVFRAQAG